MRKTLFIFVFSYALGAFSVIWLLSPGSVKDFISKATENGQVNIQQAQNNASWASAEEKIIAGSTKVKEAVSEWDLFNSVRAQQYVSKN